MVRKRKHCTKATIEADNKAALEKKAAKEAKRFDRLKKIANLEMRTIQTMSHPDQKGNHTPFNEQTATLSFPLAIMTSVNDLWI